MERVLTVEFGPSRSKLFRRAVEESESGAGECNELEPGSYRVRFMLGGDRRVYSSLARLLQRVRGWRATEVYEGDHFVSSYHAGDIKIVDCPFRGRFAVGLNVDRGGPPALPVEALPEGEPLSQTATTMADLEERPAGDRSARVYLARSRGVDCSRPCAERNGSANRARGLSPVG